jgi:predicted aspartyl protease
MLYLLFAASPAFPQDSSTTSCRIFFLKETKLGIALETSTIAEGETKVFTGEEYITFVLPVGPGQSSDFLEKDKRKNLIIVRCMGGKVAVKVRNQDDSEREFPPAEMSELKKYNIRVNVTGGTGLKKAFFIRDYETFQADQGPVIDLFGGMIPMKEGDYSITLEVSLQREVPKVFGEAMLEFADDLLFVKGSLNNGSTGYFIVDFGAGGTVVVREFLPENTKIQEVKGIEYSEKGEREVQGTMGGAGGEVENFLGNAFLGELRVGEITFTDVTVRVVKTFPEFGERHIVGIIGIDLLQRGDIISFDYAKEGLLSLKPEKRKEEAYSSGKRVIELPFSIATKHIFIEGRMNNIPISFMFDTGARGSIIDHASAQEAGLELNTESKRQFRGLDGNPIDAKTATVKKLYLGNWEFSNIEFYVADLPVLKNMGLQKNSGLLGNDFLQKNSRVEVNFPKKLIRLWK